MDKTTERLATLDPFLSSLHDDLASQIISETAQLPIDENGRVRLPDAMIAAAQLKERCCSSAWCRNSRSGIRMSMRRSRPSVSKARAQPVSREAPYERPCSRDARRSARRAVARATARHYVDGTFGGGGYTRAILEAADCRVLGIDRPIPTQSRAARRWSRVSADASRWCRANSPAWTRSPGGLVRRRWCSTSACRRSSSTRPSAASRSDADGPLDMRMSKDGESAADFVNTADERTLIHVLSRYGEERRARTIARAIIAARPVSPHRARARRQVVSDAHGPQATAFRHPSRDAHIPGAPHPCERQARQSSSAASRSRDARCRQGPSRRGLVPFAGRPHRQALPRGPEQRRIASVAPCTGSAPRTPALSPHHLAAAHAGRCRDRPQSARAFCPTARCRNRIRPAA